MTTTADMNLPLADPEITLGPLWAQIINTAFGRIDIHDHTTGNGVPITPAGMLINATLDMKNNALANAGYLALIALGSANVAATGSIQRIGGNLYWVNGAGVAVQITSGSSVISTGSGVLSVAVPSGYPYSVVIGDAQSVLAVDTTAARTLNLPAATNNMYVVVKDATGAAQTNNISVVPDGTDTIDGENSTYLVNANNASVGFISDGVSAWYAI